jgi:hypothetical protein
MLLGLYHSFKAMNNLDIYEQNETRIVEESPPQAFKKYAIVHLLSNIGVSNWEAYMGATLGSAFRLRKLHARLNATKSFPAQLDLVAMYPKGTNINGLEHPYILWRPFDVVDLQKAFVGKKDFWFGATTKLAAFGLEEYDKSECLHSAHTEIAHRTQY